jgi:hypothetical protein
MLGPVLVVDPPPGSALRLLVVTFQWACSTAVRLTATGSPDPSVDGARAGDGHGQLLRAGYPVSWGSRAVWAPALRFRTSTSKIAFCRRSSLNPDRPYKAAAPRRGRKTRPLTVWVGLVRKRRRLI